MSSKHRIEQAAFTVFGQKGFHRASVKEIAAKAGTNEATVFRLFKDKDGLYDEAARVAGEFYPFDKMEAALKASDDPRSTALEFSYLFFKHTNPEIQAWPYIVSIEKPSPAAIHHFGAVTSRFMAMVGAWAERMKAIGKFKPSVPVPLCGYLLMLILNEYHMDVVSHGKLDTSAKEAMMYANLPVLVDMWLTGVGA